MRRWAKRIATRIATRRISCTDQSIFDLCGRT
jgi:hypothetical protein